MTPDQGGGVITLDGVTYSFQAETCLLDEEFFETQGTGHTDDGEQYWVSIGAVSYSVKGKTLSGSGSVLDFEGGLIEQGADAPITFSATCD